MILDLGPKQEPITTDKISEMTAWQPRRNRLTTEWPDLLKAPSGNGKDWSVVLPFHETLANAFYQMCHVESIGFRRAKQGQTYYTFLRNCSEAHQERVHNWHQAVGAYIALRDCLCLSFALDYDRVNGDPTKPHTQIGELRTSAKTYGADPTSATFEAADRLVKECADFAGKVFCYSDIDCIVGMPSSDPGAAYSLPRYLAERLATVWGKPDYSPHIFTRAKRQGMKETALANKLGVIADSIECKDKSFKDKEVLIVDDLYQSGVSLNYAAMMLLKAGAKRVYGLCCEKTCRNDSNQGSA